MRYKATQFFGIAALLLLPLWAGAQQPRTEEEEIKQLREMVDKTVESYETLLNLEDWQSFYVDSILTHDYTELTRELKALREAKIGRAHV